MEQENGFTTVRATGAPFTGFVEGWYANGQKAFDGYNRANQKDGRWWYWDEGGPDDKGGGLPRWYAAGHVQSVAHS